MPNRRNPNRPSHQSSLEIELIQSLGHFYQTIQLLEELQTDPLINMLFGIISNTPTLNEAFQTYQISLDINTSIQDLKTSILNVLEAKHIQVQRQNQIQDFIQEHFPDLEFSEENLSTIQTLYNRYSKSHNLSSFYKQLKKFSKYDLTQLRNLFNLNNLDQTKDKLYEIYQEFDKTQEANQIPNKTPNPPTQNIETKPKPALTLTKPNKPTQSSPAQINLPLIPEAREIKELSLDQRIKVWQDIIQQNGYTFMEFYIKTGADQVSAQLDENNSIKSIAAQLFTFKKYTRSIYNQTLEKLFDTSFEEQKQNCTDTLIKHIVEKHPTTFTFYDFIGIDPQETQLSLTTLYDLKKIYGPTTGKNDQTTLLSIFSNFTIQTENPTSIVFADTQENRNLNLIKHYQQAAEKSEITPVSIICGSTPHIQQSKVGERSIYQIGRDISNTDYDTVSGMYQTIETIFQTNLEDEVEQYLHKVANSLQENNINTFEDFKNSSSNILPPPLTSKFDIKYLNPALRSNHKNNKTLQKIWDLLSTFIYKQKENEHFIESIREAVTQQYEYPVELIMMPISSLHRHYFNENNFYLIAKKLGFENPTYLNTAYKVIEEIYNINLEKAIIEFIQKIQNFLQEKNITTLSEFENLDFSECSDFTFTLAQLKFVFPELRSSSKSNLTEEIFLSIQNFDPNEYSLILTNDIRLKRLKTYLKSNFSSSQEIREIENAKELNSIRIYHQPLSTYLIKLGIIYDDPISKYNGSFAKSKEYLANLFDDKIITRQEAWEKGVQEPFLKELKLKLKHKYTNPIRPQDIDIEFFKTLRINKIRFNSVIRGFPNGRNIDVGKRYLIPPHRELANFLQNLLFES